MRLKELVPLRPQSGKAWRVKVRRWHCIAHEQGCQTPHRRQVVPSMDSMEHMGFWPEFQWLRGTCKTAMSSRGIACCGKSRSFSRLFAPSEPL